MKVGEIYYWVTDKAIGYKARPKFHLYLGPGNWRIQGEAFLFINKVDYLGDYPVTDVDYKFLSYPSYVGCGEIVTYSAQEIAAAGPALVGTLLSKHVLGLHDALANSQTMEPAEIAYSCACLRPLLPS